MGRLSLRTCRRRLALQNPYSSFRAPLRDGCSTVLWRNAPISTMLPTLIVVSITAIGFLVRFEIELFRDPPRRRVTAHLVFPRRASEPLSLVFRGYTSQTRSFTPRWITGLMPADPAPQRAFSSELRSPGRR